MLSEVSGINYNYHSELSCQRFKVSGPHAQSPPRNSVKVVKFLSCYRNLKRTA